MSPVSLAFLWKLLTEQKKLISGMVDIEKKIKTRNIGEDEKAENSKKSSQAGLFSDNELIEKELLSLNLDNITPLEAINLLHRWKKEINS